MAVVSSFKSVPKIAWTATQHNNPNCSSHSSHVVQPK